LIAHRRSILRTAVLPVALALLFCGTAPSQTASHPPSPTMQGDAAHPSHGVRWVDTRLYFGLGPANDAAKGVTEAQWRAFLDTEVTPRFPSGLSVVDVYGQWQSRTKPTLERIRSKMLLIDYPDTPENAAKVEAIRSAWKQRTGDESVLRVTTAADVSF
jgi:hypothetical protein